MQGLFIYTLVSYFFVGLFYRRQMAILIIRKTHFTNWKRPSHVRVTKTIMLLSPLLFLPFLLLIIYLFTKDRPYVLRKRCIGTSR